MHVLVLILWLTAQGTIGGATILGTADTEDTCKRSAAQALFEHADVVKARMDAGLSPAIMCVETARLDNVNRPEA